MAIPNTDCGKCPFANTCYMKDKHQRLDRSDGGLGLCPKIEAWHLSWANEFTCRTCHFTGKVGDRGGAKIRDHRTCLLLENFPIVERVKSRKRNCPLMEQIKKEEIG